MKHSLVFLFALQHGLQVNIATIKGDFVSHHTPHSPSFQALAQREEFFQFGDDARLFGEGWEGNNKIANLARADMGDTDACCFVSKRIDEQR